MAAQGRSRRPWLIPVALWVGVTAALLFTWQRSRRGSGGRQVPAWLSRIARLTGSVVYDDPSLALRVQLSRLIVIETAALGAWLAFVERRRVATAVSRLVSQKSDPLNLAIFRIVVFRQIYDTCYFDIISRVAALPAGLQYPPLTGIPQRGRLAQFAFWPRHNVSPAAISIAGKVMKYACVTGMLGLFSRASAGLVSFLFLFVWGRLQWYGKVDHHHHLLWFAALLALSPSGDALSVDSLIATLRGKRPPSPGPQYGSPLAFSMMLMGVVYLCPGLWKICRSGLDWAWSDSPKWMLQREWRMYGNWLPALRIDRYPLLYRTGGLGALLFELSFLWLLLGRRTRMFAGAMGVGFHMMTHAALNIEFETLRNCYVIFVDWGGILRRLQPLPDGRGSVSSGGFRSGAREQAGLDGFRSGAREQAGFQAMAIAGTLLVVGNLWLGLTRASDGWPLACYPQFDGLSEPCYRTMRMMVRLKDGSEREIFPDDYRGIFGNRWNNLLQRILESGDSEERQIRLRLIWQVLGRTERWIADARHVQFYSVRSFVDPSRWGEEPDDPQLLFETDVTA